MTLRVASVPQPKEVLEAPTPNQDSTLPFIRIEGIKALEEPVWAYLRKGTYSQE
jgi:hypothetical protein